MILGFQLQFGKILNEHLDFLLMSEDVNKNLDDGDDKGRRIRDSSRTTQPNGTYRRSKNEEDMRLWGILIFGIIGATATTFAVGQLRRTADWFYSQFTMSQSSFKGKGSSGGSSFQEEARRRYTRRMREEYEEEMERVERIRRMQRVFNREKNKYRRGYERWREEGEYHQHFQRDDWYWKTDTSYGYGYGNWSKPPPQAAAHSSMSHHYAILGLSRSRTTPYTDDEIKTAFRSKAKQYHPDQNQENKDVAEARFKEVMTSYEAIKSERKNIK